MSILIIDKSELATRVVRSSSCTVGIRLGLEVELVTIDRIYFQCRRIAQPFSDAIAMIQHAMRDEVAKESCQS